jgi:hypothetical protein
LEITNIDSDTLADAKLASIGKDAVAMVGDMLDSLGLWPFTQHLGWTVARFTELIDAIRVELQNPDLKLYLPM